MTPEVWVPALLLLAGVAVAWWAFTQDRKANHAAVHRMDRVREQNRVCRAYVNELTQWGTYSMDHPPRNPPPIPLALEGWCP